MKKMMFMLLAFITIVFASHGKNGNLLDLGSPVFSWSGTSFDFGKIKANVPVTHEFTFINTGKAPLVITSVQASCGCTVTEYSKLPIPVGQKGFVKATYNAAKVGVFTKTVSVKANTETAVIQLTIQGEVIGD